MALSAKAISATISATTSSSRTAYPVSGNVYYRVYNSGTVPVYIRSGDSSVAATNTDQFVPSGSTIVIIRDVADTNLAALASSTTATVYFAATDSPSATNS